MDISRRQILRGGAALGMGAMLPLRFAPPAWSQAASGVPLLGNRMPQFQQALPLLSLANGPIRTIVAGTGQIDLRMQEFQADILPPGTVLPALGRKGQARPTTWVYGYRDLAAPAPTDVDYIGPVIVAKRGTPTQIRWINGLGKPAAVPTGDGLQLWSQASDLTIHWANPDGYEATMGDRGHYTGPIPAVPHLHGGEVPPELDGGPDSWFTSEGKQGHSYYSGAGGAAHEAVYRYPNSQEPAPIWFHDHVLGGTRLNVYAGLAGAYWIYDDAPSDDNDLLAAAGLHPLGMAGAEGDPDYVVPLVIQDRTFDTAGQLFFDAVGLNAEHPYWVPEFVGDTIVVNGKVWPFMNVEPRPYRFLFINGSNARAYEMFLQNLVSGVKGPAMYQVGTDGGYLDATVTIEPNSKALPNLVLMPGERADVVIDFSAVPAGTSLTLRNIARHPYPGGAPANALTTGRIVQFRVGPPGRTDISFKPQLPLRRPMVRLVEPVTGTLAAGVTVQATRQLTLNEVMGPGGPLEVLVNNTKLDGTMPGHGGAPMKANPDFVQQDPDTDEFFSEVAVEGTTEVWQIINLTADAHPIHTHLVQFQLMKRQPFDAAGYTLAYDAAFPGAPDITDPMTGLPYPPGVYMPGFGPPMDYGKPGTGGTLGGNPDVTPFLVGAARPPAANEAGWKDTVTVFPGEATTFVVRFAPTDKAIGATDLRFPFDPHSDPHGYVWHCHIVDHEDNEMMRPLGIDPAPGETTRAYVKGVDY